MFKTENDKKFWKTVFENTDEEIEFFHFNVLQSCISIKSQSYHVGPVGGPGKEGGVFLVPVNLKTFSLVQIRPSIFSPFYF